MYHPLSSPRWRPWPWSESIVALAILSCLSTPAGAQTRRDEGPPKPKNIRIETTDGVDLRCTYYGGTEGKRTVPIIMLHGWDGVRGEYSELATFLQSRGHAVIVPDLRGHGRSGSTEVKGRPLDRKRMTRNQIALMLNDIEACKKYLLERHNAGELNIDTLCVIAAEETCVLAMTWAIRDWSWPELTTGKQGQDVKALVLLSPVRVFRGLALTTALQHDLFDGRKRYPVSLMIVVGDRDSKALRDASGINSLLSRTREKVSSDVTGRNLYRKHSLAYRTEDVELQGTKLLEPALRLDRQIRDFLRYRVVDNAAQYRWEKRGR